MVGLIDTLLLVRKSLRLIITLYPDYSELINPVITALEAAIAKLVVREVQSEN